MNSPTLVDIARAYQSLGWVPVRILPGKKQPAGGNGWEKLRPTPEEWRPGEGVGLLLGDPSQGLTDIDLDCPEALALAPHFLPPTQRVHGRTGAPAAHWWYIAEPAGRVERLADPTLRGKADGKATLVEIRGTGGQTVVPPTIHPSGQPLRWERDGAPALVALGDLQRAARRLAAAALLARHWPGERHFASLALTGALARAGWNAEDSANFVAAIASYVNGDDGEMRKRMDQARSSTAKVERGTPATGWKTLLEMGIAAAVISKVQEWLEVPSGPLLDEIKSSEPIALPPASASADRVLDMVSSNARHAFDDQVLAIAASLRREDPGEYERVVITLKQQHGAVIRVHRWEQAVGQVAKTGTARTPQRWHARLLRTSDGTVRPALANAVAALTEDTRWEGVLAWNEHSHQVEWHSDPPWPAEDSAAMPRGKWSEHEDALLVILLEHDLGMSLRPGQARAAATTVARRNSYHPIRQYLDQLPPWDQVPRADAWLARYLGAQFQPPEYLTAIGRWVLIGAIARAMQPGAKVDNVMVLEGAQGAKKSSAIRVLGGEWYVELDAASLGTTDKDTLLNARLAWIVEAGEFDSLRDASMARLKNIVSRPADTYRAPYGHDSQIVPRGWICIGTTNAETYLRDTSGARRFWPVKCGPAIDLMTLAADRDQLWAEALSLFRAGARWWPSLAEENALAAVEQEERRSVDPWEPVIGAWVGPRELTGQYVTVAQLLGDCLGIPAADWNRHHEMRAADCLRALGWRKGTRRRDGGRLIRPYYPPGTLDQMGREPGEED
jgi:predicted P-loop ATPase